MPGEISAGSGGVTTRGIMWRVVGALLPGIGVSVYCYGLAYLGQLILLISMGLVLEYLCLYARGIPAKVPQLSDGSTVLTCLLIGLALPPEVPLTILCIAVLGAVGLAKHLFGGLGHNLFNPAMVGYCLILIAFPAALTDYSLTKGYHATAGLSAFSGATPLDLVSHRGGATFLEVSAGPQFGSLGGLPWQWLNLAYLSGGLLLLALKLIRWRICVGVLFGLAIPAAATYDGGSSLSHGSLTYHWFTGATMLGAFFIATDPVTHPSTRKGQWGFGLLVGLLTFVIRAYGTYPDGMAFAILLANCATPWLNQVTQKPALQQS